MKKVVFISILFLTGFTAFGQKIFEFTIEGMSCQECVNTATLALSNIQGVDSVWIDLDTKRAIVLARNDVSELELKSVLETETSFEALFNGETLVKPLTEKEKEGLDIQTIKGGHKIKFKNHIAEGKTTIFDFYADWCGPCRVFSPKVEQYIKENPSLTLRKVDVVDWKSELAKQLTRDYQVPALPFALIFDAKGKLLGRVEGNNMEQLKGIIERK